MGNATLSPKGNSLEKDRGVRLAVALSDSHASLGIQAELNRVCGLRCYQWHLVKMIGLGNRRPGFSLIWYVTLSKSFNLSAFLAKIGLTRMDS